MELDECPICEDEGGEYIDSGCINGHKIHKKCSQNWLTHFNKCPECGEPFARSLETVQEMIDYLTNSDDYEKVHIEEISSKVNNMTMEQKINFINLYPGIFEFIDKTPELCRVAVGKDPFMLKHVPEHLMTPQLCLITVTIDGRFLYLVPERFRTAAICNAATENTILALKYVPKNLVTGRMAAIVIEKEKYSLMGYIPDEFKTF